MKYAAEGIGFKYQMFQIELKKQPQIPIRISSSFMFQTLKQFAIIISQQPNNSQKHFFLLPFPSKNNVAMTAKDKIAQNAKFNHIHIRQSRNTKIEN